MRRQLLDKNLDVFPQNSTFFIQILMMNTNNRMASSAINDKFD